MGSDSRFRVGSYMLEFVRLGEQGNDCLALMVTADRVSYYVTVESIKRCFTRYPNFTDITYNLELEAQPSEYSTAGIHTIDALFLSVIAPLYKNKEYLTGNKLEKDRSLVWTELQFMGVDQCFRYCSLVYAKKNYFGYYSRSGGVFLVADVMTSAVLIAQGCVKLDEDLAKLELVRINGRSVVTGDGSIVVNGDPLGGFSKYGLLDKINPSYFLSLLSFRQYYYPFGIPYGKIFNSYGIMHSEEFIKGVEVSLRCRRNKSLRSELFLNRKIVKQEGGFWRVYFYCRYFVNKEYLMKDKNNGCIASLIVNIYKYLKGQKYFKYVVKENNTNEFIR